MPRAKRPSPFAAGFDWGYAQYFYDHDYDTSVKVYTRHETKKSAELLRLSLLEKIALAIFLAAHPGHRLAQSGFNIDPNHDTKNSNLITSHQRGDHLYRKSLKELSEIYLPASKSETGKNNAGERSSEF